MRGALLCCIISLCVAAAFGTEDNDENAAREGFWNNLHVCRAFSRRGGLHLTDDSYLEWEFDGHKGVLNLYGYTDYKNFFDDASSDVPDGENWFVDIKPRLSIDRLFGHDFSIGPIREWPVIFSYYYADTCQGPGLNMLWSGIDINTELPWLDTVELNLYARYIDKNYGVSNKNAWDGYVAHMSWSKPLTQPGGKRLITLQGLFGYESGSKLLDENDTFECEHRTDDGFQAYLKLWYHTECWKPSYGVKAYRNMIQWCDDE